MAVFVGFTIQFLTFIFDAVTFLFLPWQPDQDFGGEKGLLHHTHTWILFRLLRRGTSLQILFWKIQILTIFIYAKRWMGLLRSTLQLLRQKHSCITNNKKDRRQVEMESSGFRYWSWRRFIYELSVIKPS